MEKHFMPMPEVPDVQKKNNCAMEIPKLAIVWKLHCDSQK